MTADGKRVGVFGSRSFLAQHFIRHMTASDQAAVIIPLDRPDFDLKRPDSLAAADFATMDYVVNFAAISAPVHDDFREVYETNAYGQKNLLEALVAAGFSGRHLFVSTGYVYAPEEGRCSETAKPDPGNHYGCSKLLAEVYCGWKRAQLDIVIARPFNCIGQGQGQNFLLPKLVAAYATKSPLLEVGNLDIERDFVDARDAARMFELALLEGERGATYNISNSRTTSIREILVLLSEISGHSPEVRSIAQFQRASDVLYQCGENTAIGHLGYNQRYTLKESLRWMLSRFAA